MGNSMTGTDDPALVSQFKTIQHPDLGTIKICQSLRNSYMQLRFLKTQEQYKLWADNVETRNGLSYLLRPIGHQKDKDKLTASKSILINYDLYPYVLSSQIHQRAKQNKPYHQKQLWLLLYYLNQAASEIIRLNLPTSGFIQPKHVFMNKHGDIKVASPMSWPDTRIQTIMFNDSKLSYFAPEHLSNPHHKSEFQVSQMGYQIEDPKANAKNQLAASFSIGLTMLSAINLQDYQYLYSSTHHGKPEFEEKEFIKVINEFKKNNQFSQIFRATICSLLDLNPEKRIKQSNMEKWISQYRASIFLKENFTITEPPAEVVRNIELVKSLVQYSMVLNPGSNLGSVNVGSSFSRQLPVIFSRK